MIHLGTKRSEGHQIRGVKVIHFGMKRSEGGVELNYQLLDPEEPTLASQNKLKVSPEGYLS